MTFRRKIILLLLIVAVVPVAFSGALSIRTSQEEMTARIRDFHNKSAAAAADGINSFFEDAVTSLTLATSLIPFEQFPKEDLYDALKIPYRQFDFINAVALLDQAGRQLADPAFEETPEKIETLKNHESVSVNEIQIFGSHIPLKAALATGTAFSQVYFNKRTKTPRIALSVIFPVQQGTDRWVLAVEISLRSVLKKMLAIAPAGGGSAFIVDGEGRVVCHTNKSLMAKREKLSSLSIVSKGLKKNSSLSERYESQKGHQMAGAFAPISLLSWGLVVAQPVEEAFASVHRMQTYTVFWVVLGLIVAVLGGVLLARGVSNPIRELAAGAEAVAEGRFNWRVSVKSTDEIGRLAKTFNRMSSELEKSFETISKQNEEIAAWNKELLERVEERTKELKQAQAQILQSQKMAATGELAAGVAHEINNPLTTVRGLAQLMLRKTPAEGEFREDLTDIVEETERIRMIIQDLLRFSQEAGNAEYKDVDLNMLTRAALRMVESQLEERKITVRDELAEDLPVVRGDPAELQQAVLHIINNAKNAMLKGGVLTLRAYTIEESAIKVAITDTGVGIAKENLHKIFELFFTTKDEWSGKGLGLSVAERIIKEHMGNITVESKVGEGSTFTIILPGRRRKLHLD